MQLTAGVAPAWLKALTYGLAALIALVCVAAIAIPAGLGWDFANYYDAGRKVLAGQIGDLYDWTVWIGGAPPQGSMKFLGAPISSILYAPLGWFTPGAALVVFKVQTTLAIWLSLWLIHRHVAPAAGVSPRAQWAFAAAFLGLALMVQPLWTVYRVGGQTTPWVLLLLTIAWISHRAGRFVLTALCFAAAVAIKPFLAPALLLLGLSCGWRFFLSVAAVCTAIGLISLATLGWEIHAEFIAQILDRADEGGVRPLQYNSALTAWLDGLWLPPGEFSSALQRPEGIALASTVLRLAALGTILLLFVDIHRQRLAPEAARSLRFLLAVIAALVAPPITWEHYLALLFPLFALVAASHRQFSRAGLALAATIVVLLVGQNLVLLMWLAAHIDTQAEQMALGIFKSLPLVLTLAFLVLERRGLYASVAAYRS